MVLIDMGTIPLPQPGPRKTLSSAQSEPAKPHKPVKQAKITSGNRRAVKSTIPTRPVADKPLASDKVISESVLCDRDAALAVRKKAQEIALLIEQGKVLNVTLGEGWAYYSPGLRRSFVERFSAADTCLNGAPRQIHFFFHGEEVASSDIHGGVGLK